MSAAKEAALAALRAAEAAEAAAIAELEKAESVTPGSPAVDVDGAVGVHVPVTKFLHVEGQLGPTAINGG